MYVTFLIFKKISLKSSMWEAEEASKRRAEERASWDLQDFRAPFDDKRRSFSGVRWSKYKLTGPFGELKKFEFCWSVENPKSCWLSALNLEFIMLYKPKKIRWRNLVIVWIEETGNIPEGHRKCIFLNIKK